MTLLARRVTAALLGSALALAPAPAFASARTHHPVKVVQHKGRHTAKPRPTVTRKAPPARRAVVTTVPAKPISPPAVPVTVAAPIVAATLTPYEAKLLADLNAARASAGLPAVVAVAGATQVARQWAATLAGDGALSHNPDLVAALTAAGVGDWSWIAENVGEGSPDDADQVFGAYMASPAHRDNILDPRARYVGIGAVEVDAAGQWPTTYDVIDFSDVWA